MEKQKAPTWAFSWLKAHASAFLSFQELLKKQKKTAQMPENGLKLKCVFRQCYFSLLWGGKPTEPPVLQKNVGLKRRPGFKMLPSNAGQASLMELTAVLGGGGMGLLQV